MRRSYVLLFAFGLVGCGDDSSSASYERRIEAAEARVVEATCSCLWTAELRRQCRDSAERTVPSHCTPELSQRLSSRYPAYANCLAENAEKEARCIEEQTCPLYGKGCFLDGVAACGPAPSDLDPDLAMCLPLFTCRTGQRVPLTLRCNGKQDCFDRSDEHGCDALTD